VPRRRRYHDKQYSLAALKMHANVHLTYGPWAKYNYCLLRIVDSSQTICELLWGTTVFDATTSILLAVAIPFRLPCSQHA
jgi:hypothetical protein